MIERFKLFSVFVGFDYFFLFFFSIVVNYG